MLTIVIITLLSTIFYSFWLSAGMAKMRRLADIPEQLGPNPPKVSIIIPACNEATTIEAAMARILEIDYPNLEIIAINDRSSDDTLNILKRLATRDARLQVFSIDSLPYGWLGKCNAMEFGRQQAQGKYLLFTDADVHIADRALTRAISYMESQALDHLVALPRLHAPTVGLKMYLPLYLLAFYGSLRPWLAKDPQLPFSVGFGAFNLVRAETCARTHAITKIALCPDEDLKLGKVLKAAGAKQEAVFGADSVSLEWYSSLPSMIEGLKKNTFAFYRYELSTIVRMTILILCWYILPVIALPFLKGPLLFVTAAICGVTAAIIAIVIYKHDSAAKPAYALLYPIAALVMLAIMWRSALSVLRNKGVTWRGTFYPLSLLKSGLC